MVVTPDIISKVLHVPKVAHPDYPSCERLSTVSKDELLSPFCETPSSWGDRQKTSCSIFAKGPGILNIVITFILHPLSHYNTITESRAWFLLSLIEGLTIDFHSHFILSLIDVFRDTMTRDKLIFPFAITRLLCYFSISYPESPHFSYMCAIDTATIRRSLAPLRLRHPQMQMAAPPTSTAPSTSAPSSSTGGVTLEAIMAQLVRMDARFDTLNDELCQVNTHVDGIARRQAMMGGYTMASSPKASEDENDGSGSADDVEDDDYDSPSDDEMSI